MSDDYYTTIMRMRQERAGRERAQEMREIQEDYQVVQQARDEAAQRGDVESFEGNDDHLIQLERRWNQLNPPRPPQADPRLVDFIKQNSTYFEKFGQNALAACNAAHDYIFRPRRSDTNDPRLTGMGWHPQNAYTPQYFNNVKALLELHGEALTGAKYDPNEQALTPTEAAKISGLSPKAYNDSVRAMHAQGRLGIYKR